MAQDDSILPIVKAILSTCVGLSRTVALCQMFYLVPMFWPLSLAAMMVFEAFVFCSEDVTGGPGGILRNFERQIVAFWVRNLGRIAGERVY